MEREEGGDRRKEGEKEGVRKGGRKGGREDVLACFK